MKNITTLASLSSFVSTAQATRTYARSKSCCLLAILLFSLLWNMTFRGYAAGGGENMLLVVNSADEPSLRIANAYVKARNIPINNILYISAPGAPIGISPAVFASKYQTPILDAIAARGLTNQIDYIGTIGSPHYVNGSYTSGSNAVSCYLSFHDCLNHLTQFQNGMLFNDIIHRNSELFQSPPLYNSSSTSFYTRGSNTAIYHSQKLTPTPASNSGTASTVQWYMSGMIGYSGVRGLTTSQAIQNLQRTVTGDGKNPQGTIYFEDSKETRTEARSPYWPAVQAYLDNVGIPWMQELNIFPKNRQNVRGAVIGTGYGYTATQTVNGSAYLPGSWADIMTSFGGCYSDSSQIKVSNLLLAGAAGTAGTVTEPYATQARFTYASLYLFSNDGSTLGEAFYKSVTQPDYLMFQGDLLSQAYADVPVVTFTSGPADGASVSGVVSVSASAHLNSSRIATGIAQLKLFVDGLQSGPVVSGSSGSFNLDTTALTDGIHEVRIVAYNNSQAASEGYALKNLVVNNSGQSVNITGTNSYNIAWDQTLSIPVTASQGTGSTIAGIQLQSLGRVVGSISGLSGNVSLSGTNLAFGINTITPVAILSSGTQQVQGAPITVTRQFQQFPGKAPTPLANRNPGFDFYFFGGAASSYGCTLDTIDFNTTPSSTLHSASISINPGNTYTPGTRNMPPEYSNTTSNVYAYGLAIMMKSNFTVTAAGEYFFSPDFRYYTSGCLVVDGTTITRRDQCSWNSSIGAFVWNINTPAQGIYLLPGEHTLTVKLGNFNNGSNAYSTSFALTLRGPDGNTLSTGASSFYTIGKRLSQ